MAMKKTFFLLVAKGGLKVRHHNAPYKTCFNMLELTVLHRGSLHHSNVGLLPSPREGNTRRWSFHQRAYCRQTHHSFLIIFVYSFASCTTTRGQRKPMALVTWQKKKKSELSGVTEKITKHVKKCGVNPQVLWSDRTYVIHFFAIHWPWFSFFLLFSFFRFHFVVFAPPRPSMVRSGGAWRRDVTWRDGLASWRVHGTSWRDVTWRHPCPRRRLWRPDVTWRDGLLVQRRLWRPDVTWRDVTWRPPCPRRRCDVLTWRDVTWRPPCRRQRLHVTSWRDVTACKYSHGTARRPDVKSVRKQSTA